MNPPPSKSFPNRNLRHFSSRPAAAVLDTVKEDDKEGDRDAPGPSSSTNKMTQPKKQASQLHRLSQFLPRLNTNSKLQKDSSQRPSILRKPLSVAHELPVPPPPLRSAPQLPILDLDHPQSPDSPANHHTNRLQKHGSPAQQKALARIPPPIPQGLTPEPLVPRARGNSLVPSNMQSEYGGGRSVSTPLSFGRPDSYQSDGEGNSTSKSRKSWLGRKSRNTSQDLSHLSYQAWVNAGTAKIEYNINYLLSGEKVPELWNDSADTFVYLFPKETGRGPQFRVPSTVLASSYLLLNSIQSNTKAGRSRGKSFDGRSSLTIEDATRNLPMRNVETPPYTPKTSIVTSDNQSESSGDSIKSFTDGHLYFPTGLHSAGPHFPPEDIQRLVEVRNLFALLTGQPLIAIHTCPSNFRIFLTVASLLREFEFSSEDGTSFGTAVELAFSFCLKEMTQLSDCRESREATLEALVLGEAMKSTELYNEAFAHAVGKYDEIRSIRSPIYELISPLTRNRLEKASMDLKGFQRSANDRLTDFEFPSLFAGIATSTTSAESKIVRFKAWKSSFLSMRKHVTSFYKDLHGQWPPKASSKKNNFIEGGLNRLVLKVLYSDFCDLYDFLADRAALTTRVYNEDGGEAINVSPVAAALRKLLDEYDRSSPPVQPPIPFDVPLIPTIKSLEAGFDSLSPKDQHKHLNRKLKDYETQLVLSKSHNLDADYKSPFMEMYKAFEAKEARGKNSMELSEQRHGYWIFLYACLQSLPLLTTDAPGLQYTDGVEYFLCSVPLGNLPWIEDQSQIKMAWFGVQGGQQIVSLPSDVVNHGVEATYRRSHCWTIAQKWIEGEHPGISRPSEDMEMFSPLSPPPGFAGAELGLRPSVRNRQRSSSASSQRSTKAGLSPYSRNARSQSRQSQRYSIALGLERLPLELDGAYSSNPGTLQSRSRGTSPVGYSSKRGSTAGFPTSTERKGSTFDDILGSIDQDIEKKKGKK